MDIKTYRARSMQEALDLVRQDLGPEAAVLQTRDVRVGGLLRLLPGMRRVEVTASAEVSVPSRMPSRQHEKDELPGIDLSAPPVTICLPENEASVDDPLPPPSLPLRTRFSLTDEFTAHGQPTSPAHLPAALFELYTDLIEADMEDRLARELVERVHAQASRLELGDPVALGRRAARLVEQEIETVGPIRIEPGRRRLVALVGPTGVGKTTTIAKLAADFRLKQRYSVGLITVDTYRIAAVEQLRTYADIIDLPMAVVSTPREVREAVDRMSDMDLVLMDTAGRSPRDDLKIQELRSLFEEAGVDEVHLVLAATAGAASLTSAAEQFAPLGASAVLLTKLDEVSGLGNLLSLLRASPLPLGYVTDGQNVPDDIAPADSRKLARLMFGQAGTARRAAGVIRP